MNDTLQIAKIYKDYESTLIEYITRYPILKSNYQNKTHGIAKSGG